jgi:hypothetical protein
VRSPHSASRRLVACVAGFLVGAAAVIIGIRWLLDVGGVAYPSVNLDYAVVTRAKLQRLAADRSQRECIGFLGDSTVMAYPSGQKVPEQVQLALQRAAPDRFQVLSLAAPGSASFDSYAVSFPISRSSIDRMVVAFSLASLSTSAKSTARHWRARFARPELAGWIPPRHLIRAMDLPLHAFGITFDRLLLSIALFELDLVETWHRYSAEQVRAVGGLRALRRAAEPGKRRTGWPTVRVYRHPTIRNRFPAGAMRGLLAGALAGAASDHPMLRLLHAALEVFRAAGVATLVYAVPIDVEHMRRIGVYDAAGIETTLAALERVVTSTGATFLDLHDLLPTTGFRDPAGHFAFEEPTNGPQIVAEKLAATLLRDAAPNRDLAQPPPDLASQQ